MLTTILIYIFAVLIFYLMGNLLLSFFKTPIRLNPILIFLRLIIGLVSVVSMYAICKTTGNTIQLIYPLLFILIIVYSLVQNKISTRDYWKRFVLFEWDSVIIFVIISAVFIILFQLRFSGFDDLKVLKKH